MEFYPKSSGKRLRNFKQDINLADGSGTPECENGVTICGLEDQVFSFGNVEFKVPIKDSLEDVK